MHGAGARIGLATLCLLCACLGAPLAGADSPYEAALGAGRAHEAAGRLGDAVVAYARAADLAAGSSPEAAARALVARRRQLGCQERLGDLRGLRDTSLEILALHRQRGDAGGVAQSQADLGYLEGLLGNPQAALGHLRPALERAQAEEDRVMQAELLLRLTAVQQGQRRYGEALRYAEEADRLFDAVAPRGVGHCDVRTHLAVIHLDLGNYAWAERLLLQCLEDLPVDDVGRRADAQGNLGILHAERGDFGKALVHLESARARFTEAQDDRGHALAVLQSAVVLTRSGDLDQAATLLADLAKRGALEPPLPGYRDLYEGDVRLAQKQVEPAAALYARADDAGARIGDRHLQADAQRGLAAVALRQGKVAAAVEHTRAAFAHMNALAGGLSPVAGGQARHQRRRLYEAATEIALASGSEKVAFELLERSRAFALVHRASRQERSRPEDAPPELTKAREDLTLAKIDYARVAALGLRKPEQAARARVEAAGLAYAQALDRAQRARLGASPEPGPGVADLAAVRRALGADERIVTYALTATNVHAVVIGPATWQTKDLGSHADLQAAFDALDVPYDEHAGVTKAAADLRAALLDPLALGKGVRRVLVSPEGAIGRVPFALLDGRREYAFIPSATVYAAFHGRARRGGPMLALGDPLYQQDAGARALAAYVGGRKLGPLPETRAELEATRRSKDDEIFFGEDASERTLRGRLASGKHWDTVTFACHGFANAERPWQSGLALTPRGEDDGYLSALEVFGLHVPSDLVVLSACDSAPGTDFRGDGMIGLAGAFLYAGAPRVLGGLWKVSDRATAALMTAFHAHWRPTDGTAPLAPGAALREAQKRVREDPRWGHPKYWAAWVIWGDPGS